MKKLALPLILLLILAACAPAAEIPSATASPAPSATPTATLTPTPTPVPPPVDPGFKNPANKATAPMLENGMWVVKNGDGKVMASWNKETESWTYSPENIQVKQTLIGNKVPRALLEPFLGPLPPDDPATHFKDENGNPVGYGIGPDVGVDSSGVLGAITMQGHEIFARFRGVVPVKTQVASAKSAIILEIPRSPDTSTIVVVSTTNDNFRIHGIPNDNWIFDQYKNISSDKLDPEEQIKLANERLSGQMVMIILYQGNLRFYEKIPELYANAVISEANATAIFDFLKGTSSRVILLEEDDIRNSFKKQIHVPESQLPYEGVSG